MKQQIYQNNGIFQIIAGKDWDKVIIYVCNIPKLITEKMISQKHYQYFNYIDEEISNLPDDFRLYQNFPQTFYKVTRIAFDIPQKSDVRLVIYDVYGKPVKILVECELLPGNYEVEWNCLSNKPGVYYYKMFAGDFFDSKKVLLIGN